MSIQEIRHQLLDDRAHLRPIVASRALDALLISLKLAGFL